MPERKDEEGGPEENLFCSRDGIEIDARNPRCPFPTSQCQYRELCPVKDAEREREKRN